MLCSGLCNGEDSEDSEVAVETVEAVSPGGCEGGPQLRGPRPASCRLCSLGWALSGILEAVEAGGWTLATFQIIYILSPAQSALLQPHVTVGKVTTIDINAPMCSVEMLMSCVPMPFGQCVFKSE